MIVLDGIIGATIERQTEHGKEDAVIVGYGTDWERTPPRADLNFALNHLSIIAVDADGCLFTIDQSEIGPRTAQQWNIVNYQTPREVTATAAKGLAMGARLKHGGSCRRWSIDDSGRRPGPGVLRCAGRAPGLHQLRRRPFYSRRETLKTTMRRHSCRHCKRRTWVCAGCGECDRCCDVSLPTVCRGVAHRGPNETRYIRHERRRLNRVALWNVVRNAVRTVEVES